MTFQVLESFTESKTGDQTTNEDRIYIGDDFVAVIDGATDKTGWAYGGRTGGQIAADAAEAALAKLTPEATIRDASFAMADELASRVTNGPPDGPSASVCIVSLRRREIWQIGDVSFWHSGHARRRPATVKPLDRAAASARSVVLQTYLEDGWSIGDLLADDRGRKAIEPILTRQYLLRNRMARWGYGSVDGSAVPPRFQKRVSLPQTATKVVLYSDGYPKPYGNLNEAESNLGLLVKLDPLCMNQLQGTKGVLPGNLSFDDRAFLSLLI